MSLEKKPFNTIKLLILHSRQIGFFLKGSTHDFGQKKEISPLFVSGQNRL